MIVIVIVIVIVILILIVIVILILIEVDSRQERQEELITKDTKGEGAPGASLRLSCPALAPRAKRDAIFLTCAMPCEAFR